MRFQCVICGDPLTEEDVCLLRARLPCEETRFDPRHVIKSSKGTRISFTPSEQEMLGALLRAGVGRIVAVSHIYDYMYPPTSDRAPNRAIMNAWSLKIRRKLSNAGAPWKLMTVDQGPAKSLVLTKKTRRKRKGG